MKSKCLFVSKHIPHSCASTTHYSFSDSSNRICIRMCGWQGCTIWNQISEASCYKGLNHRIENKEKGHSSRNLWSLYAHACRITRVHYAGSGQSIAFSGQWKRWTGYSAIELAIPPLFWPVNCIKIGGHVALLSDPTVYSLCCGWTVNKSGKSNNSMYSLDKQIKIFQSEKNTNVYINFILTVWDLSSAVQKTNGSVI